MVRDAPGSNGASYYYYAMETEPAIIMGKSRPDREVLGPLPSTLLYPLDTLNREWSAKQTVYGMVW